MLGQKVANYHRNIYTGIENFPYSSRIDLGYLGYENKLASPQQHKQCSLYGSGPH